MVEPARVTKEVLAALLSLGSADAHLGLLYSHRQNTSVVEGYRLCSTFGGAVLTNVVADMRKSSGSREMRGCFAVSAGSGAKGAAAVASEMLMALRGSVCSFLLKHCPPGTKKEKLLQEAREICDSLVALVVLRDTIQFDKKPNVHGLRDEVHCFGCVKTSDDLQHLLRGHDESSYTSFSSMPAQASPPSDGAKGSEAVIDLLSDDDEDEPAHKKSRQEQEPAATLPLEESAEKAHDTHGASGMALDPHGTSTAEKSPESGGVCSDGDGEALDAGEFVAEHKQIHDTQGTLKDLLQEFTPDKPPMVFGEQEKASAGGGRGVNVGGGAKRCSSAQGSDETQSESSHGSGRKSSQGGGGMNARAPPSGGGAKAAGGDMCVVRALVVEAGGWGRLRLYRAPQEFRTSGLGVDRGFPDLTEYVQECAKAAQALVQESIQRCGAGSAYEGVYRAVGPLWGRATSIMDPDVDDPKHVMCAPIKVQADPCEPLSTSLLAPGPWFEEREEVLQSRHVVVGSSVVAAVVEHALDDPTTECMGLIFGVVEEDRDVCALLCVAAAREHGSGSGSAMLPTELEEARLRVKRDYDLDLVGWFHSHPHGQLRPSDQDVLTQNEYQEKEGDSFFGLIVALNTSAGALSASTVAFRGTMMLNRPKPVPVRWGVRDEHGVAPRMAQERLRAIEAMLREAHAAAETANAPGRLSEMGYLKLLEEVPEFTLRADDACDLLWHNMSVLRARLRHVLLAYHNSPHAEATEQKSSASKHAGKQYKSLQGLLLPGESAPSSASSSGRDSPPFPLCFRVMNSKDPISGSCGQKGTLEKLLGGGGDEEEADSVLSTVRSPRELQSKKESPKECGKRERGGGTGSSPRDTTFDYDLDEDGTKERASKRSSTRNGGESAGSSGRRAHGDGGARKDDCDEPSGTSSSEHDCKVKTPASKRKIVRGDGKEHHSPDGTQQNTTSIDLEPEKTTPTENVSAVDDGDDESETDKGDDQTTVDKALDRELQEAGVETVTGTEEQEEEEEQGEGEEEDNRGASTDVNVPEQRGATRTRTSRGSDDDAGQRPARQGGSTSIIQGGSTSSQEQRKPKKRMSYEDNSDNDDGEDGYTGSKIVVTENGDEQEEVDEEDADGNNAVKTGSRAAQRRYGRRNGQHNKGAASLGSEEPASLAPMSARRPRRDTEEPRGIGD